jgi:hypothetical protein
MISLNKRKLYFLIIIIFTFVITNRLYAHDPSGKTYFYGIILFHLVVSLLTSMIISSVLFIFKYSKKSLIFTAPTIFIIPASVIIILYPLLGKFMEDFGFIVMYFMLILASAVLSIILCLHFIQKRH